MVMEAEARVLATHGPCGINAIPVSVVTIDDNHVYLYNFFMDKTVRNIQDEQTVAFTAWKGFAGVQMKATASYVTTGDLFATAVETMKKRFPNRVLSGVIVLTPTSFYDCSAGATAGQQIL